MDRSSLLVSASVEQVLEVTTAFKSTNEIPTFLFYAFMKWP